MIKGVIDMKENIKLEVNWDDFFDRLFYFILKLMLLGLCLTLLIVLLVVFVYLFILA